MHAYAVSANEAAQPCDRACAKCNNSLTDPCLSHWCPKRLQIPFDSTVRVSLDTNLCMIKENPEDAPSCHESGR